MELYPSYKVSGIAKQSGQRAVYFGEFCDQTDFEPKGCVNWGRVVLKVTEATSKSAIAYWSQEVELLSQLSHDSYPKHYYHEIIKEDPQTETPIHPQLLISFEEFIESNPLSLYMQDYADEGKLIGLICDLVKILSVIWEHKNKFVHRDIKPDNILVRPDGKIVVIDLGILRQEGQPGVTNTMNPYGPCTPLYASPEQLVNDKRNISFKSDLFSIGILAYQLLTNQHPFIKNVENVDFDELIEGICEKKQISLKDIGYSSKISDIIDKLLMKEPYRRYRSINKLLEELSA
ncbi:serine/threonine protein kinase [Acerihabitans arboris]|uniref:Protein kinase n=1 Tax=Acerihabitans arboris TaxID=2691583 RepID=A0A845SP65_9GAMM|nr:protein kinase [Acerihabitans arboris]NDL65869.1 protein kinase [Acerihabitans arboris]